MTKVAELSVEEFKELVHRTVEDSLESVFEDILALSSPEFLKSIIEAREDYREGRTKAFEEIFNV